MEEQVVEKLNGVSKEEKEKEMDRPNNGSRKKRTY
jgi:hypothetical protein